MRVSSNYSNVPAQTLDQDTLALRVAKKKGASSWKKPVLYTTLTTIAGLATAYLFYQLGRSQANSCPVCTCPEASKLQSELSKCQQKIPDISKLQSELLKWQQKIPDISNLQSELSTYQQKVNKCKDVLTRFRDTLEDALNRYEDAFTIPLVIQNFDA